LLVLAWPSLARGKLLRLSDRSSIDDLDDSFNYSREIILNLMLPKTQDAPALRAQGSHDLRISRSVAPHLLVPECGSRFRSSAMNGTAMPEAAINKDRNAGGYKHDIGPADALALNPVPKTYCPEGSTQRDLRDGVATSDLRHAEPALCSAEYIHNQTLFVVDRIQLEHYLRSESYLARID
jgi:hypothetical protein